MVALSDESTLSDIITGRIAETSDIQRLALRNRANILTQAKQNASFDEISKNVLDRLTSEKVQMNKFRVESIYESKAEGDENANLWFNATKLDKETRSKIKKVRRDRMQALRPLTYMALR